MRAVVRRVVALSVAVVGLLVQAGGSGAASVATGHEAGAAVAAVSGCDEFWFMGTSDAFGLAVLRADGTVVGPRAAAEVVLRGAACGARVGQAELNPQWFVQTGPLQEVSCLGSGVYTFQPHVSLVAIRGSVLCTWYHPFGQLQFVGQVTGDITPGVSGHAAMVINLA